MNLRIQSALAFPPLKAFPPPSAPLPRHSAFHSWRSLSYVVSPFPPLVAMYNWRRQFALVDEAIPYLGIRGNTSAYTRTPATISMYLARCNISISRLNNNHDGEKEKATCSC
ncbi:hypothetical protein PUN28_001889 [Cardiocondyla obscurior]|uniref:Uncharacterized protein n=1 Tax=Cardiocondyla obscurior TaxID=286306 RepID=A0AAW2GRL3_9HYME